MRASTLPPPSSLNEISWQIIGAGSIGRLFANRLARAGYAVQLLGRDAPVMQPTPTLLLVATKTPDVIAALARHVAGAGQGQLVLLLQNGMGTAEAVRTRWPALRLWSAVTTAAAWRDDTGELHVVTEGETQAGLHDGKGAAWLDAQVHGLATAGILRTTGDIRAVQWRKLAVNALVNPLSALLGCRNGELPARAGDRLRALASEFDAVARAEGQPLDSLALATAVIAQTAGNFSSMNRDIAAGRRTEIDAITGYVVARATAHGIAVPAHAQLLTLIAPVGVAPAAEGSHPVGGP